MLQIAEENRTFWTWLDTCLAKVKDDRTLVVYGYYVHNNHWGSKSSGFIAQNFSLDTNVQ